MTPLSYNHPRAMKATRAKKSKRPARPRVPLPRQTGGMHEDKTKRPWRRRKHKGGTSD